MEIQHLIKSLKPRFYCSVYEKWLHDDREEVFDTEAEALDWLNNIMCRHPGAYENPRVVYGYELPFHTVQKITEVRFGNQS